MTQHDPYLGTLGIMSLSRKPDISLSRHVGAPKTEFEVEGSESSPASIIRSLRCVLLKIWSRTTHAYFKSTL